MRCYCLGSFRHVSRSAVICHPRVQPIERSQIFLIYNPWINTGAVLDTKSNTESKYGTNFCIMESLEWEASVIDKTCAPHYCQAAWRHPAFPGSNNFTTNTFFSPCTLTERYPQNIRYLAMFLLYPKRHAVNRLCVSDVHNIVMADASSSVDLGARLRQIWGTGARE